MAKFLDETGVSHLVSSLMQNTKTVNGQSIWGTGDITIEAGGGSGDNIWEADIINKTYAASATMAQNTQITKPLTWVCVHMTAVSQITNDIPILINADTSEQYDRLIVYFSFTATRNLSAGVGTFNVYGAATSSYDVYFAGPRTILNNQSVITSTGEYYDACQLKQMNTWQAVKIEFFKIRTSTVNSAARGWMGLVTPFAGANVNLYNRS